MNIKRRWEKYKKIIKFSKTMEMMIGNNKILLDILLLQFIISKLANKEKRTNV